MPIDRAPRSRRSSRSTGRPGAGTVAVSHPALGEYHLSCEGEAPLLFTENETNTQRLFGDPNDGPYVKDGINDYVVHGQQDAVNPEQTGHQGRGALPADDRSRAGEVDCACGFGSGRAARRSKRAPQALRAAIRRRLRRQPAGSRRVLQSVTPPSVNDDAANVMRQALAGMLWSQAVLLLRRATAG